jgi:hypothetical protein
MSGRATIGNFDEVHREYAVMTIEALGFTPGAHAIDVRSALRQFSRGTTPPSSIRCGKSSVFRAWHRQTLSRVSTRTLLH